MRYDALCCYASKHVVPSFLNVTLIRSLNFATYFIKGIGIEVVYQSLDSSVGRAEDCKGKSADILRSLVQIRSEGEFFTIFCIHTCHHLSPKNPLAKFCKKISFSSRFGNLVFGCKVTKILCNSLFTFLLSKARQANRKIKVKKIILPNDDKTKNEVTKICNEPGIKL